MTDSREEPLNNSLTKSEPVEDTTAKDDGEIHSGVGVLDKTVKILDEDRLLTAAGPILQTLLDRTGESAQIYRRQGDQRVCIAAVERTSGLRDSIPVGAMLSMEAGSAAQILLAWEDSDRLHQGLRHAKFTATKLAAVRKRGWSESVNEREEGVCSISAPIRNASGQVIAAISISGPTGRMGAAPGRRYAPLVMAAGKYLTEALVKAVR